MSRFIIAYKKVKSEQPEKPVEVFDETYHGPILVNEMADISAANADTCSCCGNGSFMGYWIPADGTSGITRVWHKWINCEGPDPSWIQFNTSTHRWEIYDGCCDVTFIRSKEITDESNAKSPWDYTYSIADPEIPVNFNICPTYAEEKADGTKAAYLIKTNTNEELGHAYVADETAALGYYYATGKTINGKPQYTNNLYYMQYIEDGGADTYGWVLTQKPDKTSSTTNIADDPDFVFNSFENNGNPEDIPTFKLSTAISYYTGDLTVTKL